MDILLVHFRHQKYTSFQRQLNLYGFRKIMRGPNLGSYAHEHFLRDRPEVLHFVRRVSPGQKKSTAAGQKKTTSIPAPAPSFAAAIRGSLHAPEPPPVVPTLPPQPKSQPRARIFRGNGMSSK